MSADAVVPAFNELHAPDFDHLSYETIDEGHIAIISLSRGLDSTQHRDLLVELDLAFRYAERDDAVRVVILRGIGDAFPPEREVASWEDVSHGDPDPGSHPSYHYYGGTRAGIERNWLQEYHFLLANTRRWRELRKITVASVRGGIVAGALMLMWACDIIVSDATAYFADPVGPVLGIPGVEYFAHPWEWGSRRAKDLLLTGDPLSADEAYEIGAINKVFPAGTLEQNTIDFARRAAAVPTAASLMIKEAVNQTQDIMGFHSALQGSFSLHELSHSHWGLISCGTTLNRTSEPDATPEQRSSVGPMDIEQVKAEEGR